MPQAPLDVNWEAVRAHAVTHGVRAAAEAFGIAPGTLTARSCREGWLRPIREAQAAVPELPKSMQPKAVMAVKAPEAALNQRVLMGEKTRIVQSRAVLKGSRTMATKTGDVIIANAQQLKSLVDAADKLHGWSKADAAPSLVLNLGVAAPAAAPADPLEMLRSCAIPEQ